MRSILVICLLLGVAGIAKGGFMLEDLGSSLSFQLMAYLCWGAAVFTGALIFLVFEVKT